MGDGGHEVALPFGELKLGDDHPIEGPKTENNQQSEDECERQKDLLTEGNVEGREREPSIHGRKWFGKPMDQAAVRYCTGQATTVCSDLSYFRQASLSENPLFQSGHQRGVVDNKTLHSAWGWPVKERRLGT
jgi:hypothetical protein